MLSVVVTYPVSPAIEIHIVLMKSQEAVDIERRAQYYQLRVNARHMV
jgi:hypothetical protein